MSNVDKIKLMNLTVKQNNKLLKTEIRNDGCYLMTLLSIYQAESGVVFNPYQINKLYDILVNSGTVTTDCYITLGGASKIFETASQEGGVIVSGQWLWNNQPDTIDDNPNITHTILLFKRDMGRKRYYHFVLGDKNGNILYDPIPNSKTVTNGKLHRLSHYNVEHIKI